MRAVKRNSRESVSLCELACIEQYEMKWLKKTGASIVGNKVKDIDLRTFGTLKENEFLFKYSSHVIWPNGDALFIFHTMLPIFKNGVHVHEHDIFSPSNYLDIWVVDKCLL
jgi:hypothetical protein